MNHDSTPLVKVLHDAFGPAPELPASCWIKWALSEDQGDFGPAIEMAMSGSAHDDMVRRLREEHPLNREHRLFHDYGLLNFFTEVEAFAWAVEVANLPEPRFITVPGSPDLIAGSCWIEAKTINKSAEARAFDERVIRPALEAGQIVMSPAIALVPPLPGLIAKFRQTWKMACASGTGRAETGELVMFYDWINVDFGISRRDAERAVLDWAKQQERATGVSIVIVWNYNWQTPIYQGIAG